MQIYKSLNAIKADHKNAVLVIGNFDGVHRGHQLLIEQAAQKADEIGAKTGLLTFEPHPRTLFRPSDPPFRITPEPVKIRRLSQCPLDFVVSLPFDWDFASQNAQTFIRNVLTDCLEPQMIYIGYDFRFGQMRKGSFQDLEKAGYETIVVSEILDPDGNPYSSSDIRSCLRHGYIHKANDNLGWEWEIQGQVFKGDQRGRELGYPTANIAMINTVHPAYGVYASKVQILDNGEDSPWLNAATNIGIRPMFEVPTGQVEAYILDFDGDLYGKTLRVKPVKLLRGEAKFDSLDALITQMDKDCAEARKILS